ncbi:uncharacterized protein C8Q71DRAFT_755265 [Rhodofomes roseus]|uniref:Abasic site processing protein n=1 Tax=Rhodofomes roseus TaxID=34475 RepID=A0ABQ8KIV0_9APHY|nr:uncharacterized protein C8Q71DRAFT_755265 [Rhodofomes roseus]KAH9837929.1 hypothetical protein C8Q71DRAFT_755265 [Rhodofomes roseus]
MCGRYSLGLPHADIQEMHGYNVHVGEWVGQDQFQPRHNIAPRSQAPVLRRREQGEDGSPDDLVLQTMRWGLVPHWSKHEDKTLSTTNARRENLVEGGGMWQSIKGKRRCAVVCEGYYEWLKKGKERLPHFTKRKDGKLMLLAGLYDRALFEGETEPLWTFTIVTTDANKEFQWLHDRQPVILSSMEALTKWLDTSPQKWTPDLTKLVQPYHDPETPLACYQVPKEVGKVGTESLTFIQPVAERKDGIQAMFAKQTASTSSQPSNGSKRKRSPSPPQPFNSDKQAKEEPSQDTKLPADKLNTWEDDSEIEYVDGPHPADKVRRLVQSYMCMLRTADLQLHRSRR